MPKCGSHENSLSDVAFARGALCDPPVYLHALIYILNKGDKSTAAHFAHVIEWQLLEVLHRLIKTYTNWVFRLPSISS